MDLLMSQVKNIGKCVVTITANLKLLKTLTPPYMIQIMVFR